MKLTTFKALLLVFLSAFTASAYATDMVAGSVIPAPVEGRDYIKLPVPVKPGQKSVEEVLALWCHHCHDFHTKWGVDKRIKAMLAKDYPTATYTQYHLVLGNNDKLNQNLATLFAVMKLKHADNLIVPAFEYVANQVNSGAGEAAFQNAKVYQDWLASKMNVKSAEVASMWNSLKVKATVKNYAEVSKKFQVNQTPYFVINGRYVMLLQGLQNIRLNKPQDEIIGDIIATRVKQLMELK